MADQQSGDRPPAPSGKDRIVFGIVLMIAVAAVGWAAIKWWRVLPLSNVELVKAPMAEVTAAVALPDGFAISIFATGIPRARQMAVGDDGWIFVGTLAEKVFALHDSDGDGHADQRVVIADKLFAPNGVAVHAGALYIAEVNRVLRIANVARVLEPAGAAEIEPVITGLPSKTHHGFRYIKFAPDGALFIALGAPCNICKPADPELMGVIRRYEPGDGGGEVFAHGVRNSVGFDWHPQSGELWFTDNGRDWLGDDLPNDELNRATESGLHFGFPYCHQGDLADEEFGDERQCNEFTPPVLLTGPHVANLGMVFYRGDSFPSHYQQGAFVALHGSWNRSKKIGYAVYFARTENDEVVEYAPFATGWLSGERVLGRPVDTVVDRDGSLLISDDFNGVIYRVTYAG